MNLNKWILQARGFLQILRYFDNPILVILMRFGVFKSRYLSYSIHVRGEQFFMLGRPQAIELSDLSMIRTVLVEQEYSHLLSYLPSGPVRLVDIGANVGSFTIWISKTLGITEAICFEPDPVSCRLCSFNFQENNCHSATVIEKAVGGFPRTIKMLAESDQPCAQSIYQTSADAQETANTVQVLAFAEFLQGVSGDFDLLKLDCEGAEWEIIRETPMELFRRFKVVVAEIHTDPTPETRLELFREIFEAAGFKIVLDQKKILGLFIAVRDALPLQGTVLYEEYKKHH